MNGLLSGASIIELMRQSIVHEDTLRIMLINYLCSSNTSRVIEINSIVFVGNEIRKSVDNVV